MIHELPDGTRLRLRLIAPTDKALLARGMDQLSPRSRRQRFLVPKPSLSAAELRYLTEVDGHDHVAIVAVHDDDPAQLAGVARYVRDPARPEQAELAVTIGDALQGMGLGRTLGRVLADVAKAHGVRRFTASLLGTNVAAQRLFRSISRHIETEYRGGVADLVAELDTAEHPIALGSLAA